MTRLSDLPLQVADEGGIALRIDLGGPDAAGRLEWRTAHAAAIKRFLPSLARTNLPLRHVRALAGHIVPAILLLGADVLQSMALEEVADVLGDARFIGQRPEGAPKVSIPRMGDYTAISLPPRRAVADGLRRVFGGKTGILSVFQWHSP